jgi:hypothetical protein
VTEDEARSELAEAAEWIRTFETQQQQAPSILQRVAYLNGFLEGCKSDG